jgi:hypothetical protein
MNILDQGILTSKNEQYVQRKTKLLLTLGIARQRRLDYGQCMDPTRMRGGGEYVESPDQLIVPYGTWANASRLWWLKAARKGRTWHATRVGLKKSWGSRRASVQVES